MNNKFTRSAVIGLVIVLVLSLGVVAAFAQEDDTTPDTETMETVPALPLGRGDFGGRGGRGGHHGGADDEALATALGITLEELEAARQQVMAEQLAQAVEDGYMTQDQANTMLAMEALKSYIDRDVILAEALGMTVEEVEAAREDGALYDVLANITEAELQERTQAATEAAVQQAVTDNVIIQDQADLVLEQIAEDAGVLGGFSGRHPHGDFDGGRGGFRGVPDEPEDTEATDAGEVVLPFAFGA